MSSNRVRPGLLDRVPRFDVIVVRLRVALATEISYSECNDEYLTVCRTYSVSPFYSPSAHIS